MATDLVDNVTPRNIGAAGVTSFLFAESESFSQRRVNDTIQTAERLPLGTGSGQQDTIDVTGSLPLSSNGSLSGQLVEDIDYYRVTLRAGDILDIAGQGSIGRFDIQFANGSQWFGTQLNNGSTVTYPANSPLQTVGNTVGAQIVPFDGDYLIRVSSGFQISGATYTLGLRVYRPVLESQPIGTQQIVFLDFDGEFVQPSIFFRPDEIFNLPTTGTVVVPSLADSLGLLGFNFPVVGPAAQQAAVDRLTNELIDGIVERVSEDYNLFITQNGGNGNFNQTGIAGQFGVTILNSRDHADPGFFAPNVTRVLIGGSAATFGFAPGIYGLSEGIDVGNFDTSELVFVVLDQIGADSLSLPISVTSSRSEIAAQGIALTVSHEIAHSFGIFHTNRVTGLPNAVPSIIDANVGLVDDYELGVDGVFGTADDVNIPFPIRDQYNPVEGYIGFNYVAAGLAFGLATGTQGTSITGRVFTDSNRDGRLGSGETGLAGVTVFVDRNNNGVLDAGDTSAVSNSSGNYSLAVGSGSTVTVIAVAPNSFAGTTANQVVTVNGGGVNNINFGFNRVNADITGVKFADLDGNGFRDPGEPGISGVFIYLDLDGDDRIDLGEPRGITDAQGRYTINFPGPGTYTIREVVDPGFEQTFPIGGEHIVIFNGTSLGNNFDFGNRPNLDFGDAPDTYATTLAAGGPSHGILAGLSLGSAPDREINGVPSPLANGDDIVGVIGTSGGIVDDEDGVIDLSVISPGITANFGITLTNTTDQTGFLQAWFDFNRDGDFNDPGEQVLRDDTTGRSVYPIAIPASVTPGNLFARFRYSLTAGLGIGGQATTGEVEDHVFTVRATANIANPDSPTVTRNSQATELFLLDNDFETSTSPLTIISVNRFIPGLATVGTLTIAPGGRSVFYTPPNGFTGRDFFDYTVRTSTGETATARVTVTVTFLSDVPIAIDDTFSVNEGANNVAINVLDNDIPSRLGGVTISSVTPGTQGGLTSLTGGSQSIRYTPRPGFNGTEEFTYSISDTAGNTSSATVTVNLLPGSFDDDAVGFAVGFFDVFNNTPITNVQVGDEFLVRVTVEDLRFGLENQGVFSAFIDLLYSDELVSARPATTNPPFNFDIEFGPQFQSSFDIETGDANTPGLFNDVGSNRDFNQSAPGREGAIELFTVRMVANAPGIAVFATNPADVPENETSLFNRQLAVAINELRLGTNELTIVPSNANFTTAVDDSFPDGIDSNGAQIRGGVGATLAVTANDNLGPTGVIDQFAILTQPTRGVATIGPGNTIVYTPDASAVGFDSFSYSIVTLDGVRSSAEVTLTVGDAAADDLIAFDLRLVGGGTGPIAVGSRFGVDVFVEDLRAPLAANPLGVFAAFADILYSTGVVTPSNTITDDDFDFDVIFGVNFGLIGAFGIGSRPGIIDEFGSFVTDSNPSNDPPNPALTGEPVLLATLFFEATAAGLGRFVTGPVDSIPLRESLLFQPPDPVPVQQIRYDVLEVVIGGGSGERALHNALMPADVNDDGLITPRDALFVINEIAQVRRGEGEAGTSAIRRFADVTGDGKVTTRDALNVINTISRRNREAAAGGAAPLPTETLSTGVTPVNNYRALEEVRSRRQGVVPTVSSLSSSGSGEGFGFDDDDDKQDEWVDLLARDVANAWK